jgi:hypothetical protein
MSGLTLMERPEKLYNTSVFGQDNIYATRDMLSRAVVIEDDSVILNPSNMKLSEHYPAILNGKLYLYRRVSETRIEEEEYELDRQI